MKPRIFVDANVFLRLFTVDDQGQSERAADLFRRAGAGMIGLFSGPPVLFEVAGVLRRAYHVPRDKVLGALAAILAVSGMEVVDAELVHLAIERAQATGSEFADAYIAAAIAAHGCDAVATFNRRDFKKLGVALAAF
ncbi:MAG: PIN domain-containing protein [bacterium]